MAYQKKVEKLTYHGGRVYKPGETITYTDAEALHAAPHYGDKLPKAAAKTATAGTAAS